MLNCNDLNKDILIDSDVVRHFLHADSLYLLNKIFPDQLYMLDIVEHELMRSKTIRNDIKSILDSGEVKRLNFPTKKGVMGEYFDLQKLRFLGMGEAACLSYARYNDNIIASSNLKDIHAYCKMHALAYLTTMDFLVIGVEKGIITKTEANRIITTILLKKSKLPCMNIEDYYPQATDLVDLVTRLKKRA